MNKKSQGLLLLVLCMVSFLYTEEMVLQENLLQETVGQSINKKVHKKILKNGLTVMVVPVEHASQVVVQIWYNVGSKQESAGERGMAHFIEHMIFKGTEEKLSELDINALSSKLSAVTNAQTWFDYTQYYFVLPLANWDKVLPVFADCMQHCRFKQEHMDSEVKAVIQELKMRNDSHWLNLAELLNATVFDSHPYHYTVIGFKQDLWKLKRETLLNFYKKYYIPQNASLTVVGNIDPQEVFAKAEHEFGDIVRGATIKEEEHYVNENICSKSITLYRDVKQPIGMLAFVIPGLKEKNKIVVDALAALLSHGKSSRLYKKLVEEEKLALSIQADTFATYDANLFLIIFEPKKQTDFDEIKKVVLDEIDRLVQDGISEKELSKLIRTIQLQAQQKLEKVYSLASEVATSYWTIGDEEYPFIDWTEHKDFIREEMLHLLAKYFRRTVCHEGKVLPYIDRDREYCMKLVEQIAMQDGFALAQKEREVEDEGLKYAQKISAEKMKKACFQKPEVFYLDNGLEVVLAHCDAIGTVECVLQHKADAMYDPKDKDGMGYLAADMMMEGSNSHPGAKFAEEMEQLGIQMSSAPGCLSCSMLSSDLEEGLCFLQEALLDARFDQSDFNRIKECQILQVEGLFDDAKEEIMQKAKELVYQDHLYARLSYGTKTSLESISRDECYEFYKKMISPQGAQLIIVGNFDRLSIKDIIKRTFSSWSGPAIQTLQHQKLVAKKGVELAIEKNRDQVALAYAGLSISRFDKNYDALALFNQILLLSFDSIIFKIREETGLFYHCAGSLFLGADDEPGMIYITTMVAKDRVGEAKKVILDALLTSVDTISEEQFEQAQEVIANGIAKLYETNRSRASAFAFLKKYKLPDDFFEKRIDAIRTITKDQMVSVAKKVINKNTLNFITIGNPISLDKK